MRRTALLVILLLVVAAPVSAQHRRRKKPPIDPELAKVVEPLIEQLDDPSFAVREDATRGLMEIGPDVVPALEQAEDHASPEVRMRVRRVLMHYSELARREALKSPETGDWPMLKRGPSRGASTGSALRVRPEVSWTRALPFVVGKPYFDAALVAGRKRLYAVTRAGQVAAVDRATGEIVWTAETGERAFAGPVLADGVLYVPGPSLVAMDAGTGKERWRWKTDYGVVATPLVSGRTVYAVEKGEGLVAIDPASGEQRWRTRLSATSSAPVRVGDLVVIGTRRGVVAVNVENGNRRWLAKTDEPVTTAPALLPDRIVVGDSGRHLYALTLDRGKVIWRRRIPEGQVLESPAVYGDTVLFSTTGSTFRAIRARDGRDVWTRWTGTVIQSSPCVADGVVYLTADTWVRALDCVNGDDVWRTMMSEPFAAPILLEGSLYLLALDGVILALR